MFGLFSKKKVLDKDTVSLFARMSAEEASETDSDTILEWAKSDSEKLDDLEVLAEVWDHTGDLQPERSLFFEEEPAQTGSWWQNWVSSFSGGWRYPASAVAAMVMVAFLSVVVWERIISGDTVGYATQRASSETVKLEDGSDIHLNGLSSVQVAYNDEERRIKMAQGEVYYEVAHDAERPFIVETAGVEVRAVGTAFDIETRKEAVTVIVTEGTVAISFDGRMVEYRAGNKIEIMPGHAGAVFNVTKLPFADYADAVTWRTGVINFSGEPLSLALERINRQSKKPIILVDSSLSDLQIYGSFRQNNITSFINAIEALYPVQVVESRSRIALYERDLIKRKEIRAGDSKT